jgi:hypothetical protein
MQQTDLMMLAHDKAAWNDCPKGHIHILLGDLNIKLASPSSQGDELIAKHMGNVMGLVDVSCQFKQHCQAQTQGRWTWWMRQGWKWVFSQCDCFLRREIDRRRFTTLGVDAQSPRLRSSCNRCKKSTPEMKRR